MTFENVNKNILKLNQILEKYSNYLQQFGTLQIVEDSNSLETLELIKSYRLNEEEFNLINNLDDSMDFMSLRVAIETELKVIKGEIV